MKKNKKVKLFSLIFLILFCVYLQSVVFAAINSKLAITGDSIARIRSNVRINNFKIYEVSDGVISSYEDFSKSYTMSNVTLPYSDSYIIYELVVGNYEDVEMQLHSITGLNNNLVYELIDYDLNDAICDNTGKCFDGVEKTFYLKIKYVNYNASGTNYNINLEYEFKEFSNVITVGSTFKTTIPSSATHLIFTDEKPADGVVLTDVSFEQDMGVVGYLDGTTYKVTTRRSGVMPQANADSSYMFNGVSLTNIDLDNLDISLTRNIEGFFKDCTSLTNINFGDDWDTSNITSAKYTFENCSSLTTIDLSGFKTGQFKSFSGFFRGCSGLTSLDVSGFDTSNGTSFNGIFKDCVLLEVIDVSNFNTSKITSFNEMFSGCKSVLFLDVGNFDTSSANNISSMFADCQKITSVDVKNWDVSNVTYAGAIFRFCTSLTSLDVNSWDTSSFTSLYGIFNDCTSLTSLDLSNWDVSNVTISYWVFTGCHNLISLDVSNWHYKQDVVFSGMFHGVSSIEYIDLSSWIVDSPTGVHQMFAECRNLKEIDLSGFVFTNVTDYAEMFSNDMQLKNIYVNDTWNHDNVVESTNMFYNCVRLKNFDSNYIDGTKAYAGDDGYLSKISSFYIDDVLYKYAEGMTWEEWIESTFNINSFVIDGNNIRSAINSKDNLQFIQTSGTVGCISTDLIKSGNYSFREEPPDY